MNPLAVQLYTVREELAGNQKGVLEQLAGFGYRAVEPFDVVSDPSGLRADLDAAGLTACSVHGQLGTPEQAEAVFRGTKIVGAGTVFMPYQPPERFTSQDAVTQLAAELTELAKQAADRGLRLGYHNHDHELSATVDGRTALEALAEQAGDDVLLEVDIYWAAVGGQDVPALLGRLGPKVVALHVKDGPVTRNDPMTAVGSGEIRTQEILAAAPETAWRIVELDRCATDMMTAVRESHNWLASRGLA